MDNLSEAYLSVYQNLDEANSTETPLEKIRRRNKEYFRNNPETEQKTTQRRAEHKSTRGVKKGKGAKSAFGTMRHVGGPYKEEMEIDLFDYLLEYLVAEGYADTNENAIAIMANMSEEWREEILDEEDDRLLRTRKKSIRRLNASKNIEAKQADDDYENPIDYSHPTKGKSGYMEVPTDWKARRRRASGR